MSDKNKLIEKARQLGRKYLVKRDGCAPTTLLAVADTLKMEVPDELFKAMIGLSSHSGGCGGVCGGIAAIGLRYGSNREDYEQELEASKITGDKIRNTLKVLRDRFVEEYGGYLCTDVQTRLFGRSYDYLVPEEREVFRKKELGKKCRGVTENAAGWTVEAIIEADTE